MLKTLSLVLLLATTGLLLPACGLQQPDIGRPGQVSLVFFYTDG